MSAIEERVERAYNALEKAVNSETLNFSRWTYFTAAPLALVLPGNTDSVVTWLHPLKEKALRQTRYGSLV